MIELPPASDGRDPTVARGISSDGSVVVGSLSGGRPFRWTSGAGTVNLGLPSTPSALAASANAVSADGSVIAGTVSFPGNFPSGPCTGYSSIFLWTQGTGYNVISYGGASSCPYVLARSMSADGNTIVGELRPFNNYLRAFRATEAGIQTLPRFSTTLSSAYGISADGSVIVGYSITNNQPQGACRWVDGENTEHLPDLPSNSAAYAVSSDGSVIVGVTHRNLTSSNAQAFRWTQETGVQYLGAQFVPTAVSADGSVVVGYSFTNALNQDRAFRWTQETGMREIGTLGGNTSRAYAVSADGSVIVGESTNAAGELRAFRWVLQLDPSEDCNNNCIADDLEILSDPSLDLDGNGLIDACEIAADPSLDCNNNGILDSVEIAADPSLDCNGNGILDECELAISAVLDVVVIFDTSGSMNDDAAVLCASVSALEADLASLGFVPYVTILGITEAPGGPFSCLQGTVLQEFGDSVPGGGLLDHNEDWGDAAAIVADRFPWLNENRIIVVISDEGAQDGDPCDAADVASVNNAIAFAVQNGVKIIGVAAEGSSACVQGLMEQIAEGTGGRWFLSTDPDADLVEGITDAITAVSFSRDCNQNGILDECEIAADPSLDCNNDGILDSCQIAQDLSLDCDADGVLDACQVPGIIADTGLLGPLNGTTPVNLTINNAPEASTDVRITLTLKGDFGQQVEIAQLRMNGFLLETYFLGTDPLFECPEEPFTFEVVLTPSEFNNIRTSPTVVFSVAGSPAVSAAECPDGVTRIHVQYYYEGAPDDCNGNGIPDLCDLEIFGGSSLDENFNFIPDECENGGGPSSCPGDINADGVVDIDDFIILAGNFGSGPGMTPQQGDLNDDGFIDIDDFIILAGNFGNDCN
ncbi:MAG: hypothetical protein EA380_09245 [Phycisphaeraceae bacterium]|nr:MAG: hypothetical protein EA380_09245 [Phycisphaeraceae bacterium]